MSRQRIIGTTPEALRVEEQKLGFALPTQYAQWLLQNNGRALDSVELLPVLDSRDPRKTWNSIARHYHEAWHEWRDVHDAHDLSDLLPIAQCGDGDVWCLRRSDDAVVRWSHETGEHDVVAADFNRFVQWLEGDT
ncbi:SMI1 / KNR4 family protein [compost metagenome]|jgi:hypothetical protein